MKSFCDSVFSLEFATASSGSQGQTSPVSWHRGLAPGGEHTTSQHIGDSAENMNSVHHGCPPWNEALKTKSSVHFQIDPQMSKL